MSRSSRRRRVPRTLPGADSRPRPWRGSHRASRRGSYPAAGCGSLLNAGESHRRWRRPRLRIWSGVFSDDVVRTDHQHHHPGRDVLELAVAQPPQDVFGPVPTVANITTRRPMKKRSHTSGAVPRPATPSPLGIAAPEVDDGIAEHDDLRLTLFISATRQRGAPASHRRASRGLQSRARGWTRGGPGGARCPFDLDPGRSMAGGERAGLSVYPAGPPPVPATRRHRASDRAVEGVTGHGPGRRVPDLTERRRVPEASAHQQSRREVQRQAI